MDEQTKAHWVWLDYWKYENGITSLFVPSNWAESGGSRARATMLLAQVVSLLFLLCVSTDPTGFVCAPVEETSFIPDDDNPTGLSTVSLINDIQQIGNPMDALWMLLAYIVNSISDIFWGSIWVLPTMMLIWAETTLGDMVEETDDLCITRMMELADTDIWHAENVYTLHFAKLVSYRIVSLGCSGWLGLDLILKLTLNLT